MYIVNDAHALRLTEAEYFDHLTEKAGDPKPMIELLNEYIASLPPDENRPSGEEVLEALQEVEDKEAS